MSETLAKKQQNHWWQSAWVPYVFLWIVMFALHLQFTLGTGDDPMNKNILQDYYLMVRLQEMYERWSARQLVDAVMYLFSALPYWVWRVVDPIVFALATFFAGRLLQIERNASFSWVLVGMVLSYQWIDLVSAGWVCATLGFLWPLTACLAALQPYVNRARGQRTPVWQYVIYYPLFLYAVNMEQLLVAVGILMLGYLAVLYVSKREIPWYLGTQLTLCLAAFIYVATCPGLAMRMETEMSVAFKDFQMRSLLQKIELGISNGFVNLIYECNYLFFLFCLIVAIVIFQQYKNIVYRLMALFPLAVVTVLGLLSDIVCALIPQMWFFRNGLTSTGMITIAYAGTPKRYIAFLLLCVVFSLCIANLYIAFGHTLQSLAGVLLLCAGFSSHAMLGFSTSIWSSGDRTAFFCSMCLITINMMLFMYYSKPKTFTWRLVQVATLACASLQCVSLIGA